MPNKQYYIKNETLNDTANTKIAIIDEQKLTNCHQ